MIVQAGRYDTKMREQSGMGFEFTKKIGSPNTHN
jgi:hypothetical protein